MRLPTLEEIKAEQARRMTLAEFVRASWHVLESRCALVWGWHMDAVCDHVQAVLDGWASSDRGGPSYPAQNLAITEPPGSSKSRIVSVCAPAWRWLRRPDCRILAISGNPRVAVRDSQYCRQLLGSEWYQQTFRPRWQIRDGQDTKTNYANSEGGFRSTFTAGSKVTGDRADVIIVDDPLDAREAYSKIKRQAVNDWWDSSAANRVNDPERSVRIAIMQRLHEDDWVGHVRRTDHWEMLRIQQEYDPVAALPTWLGWRDPRTELGELMCPARFTRAGLDAERRRLGTANYAAQHQQLPAPAEGAMVLRQWWRRYRMAPKPDFVVASWDLSNSESPSADSSYVVGLLLGAVGPDRYVLDVMRAHLSPLQSEQAIRDCDVKWSREYGRPRVTLIENKAAGPAVTERIRRILPAVQASNPKGSKEERIAAIAPAVEAGNGHVPESAPWVADFLDELAAFPRGMHDDQADALSQAWLWADSHGKRAALVPANADVGREKSRWIE